MSRITTVNGRSQVRTGSTQLDFGMIKPDGTFIVRELHRHFQGVGDIAFKNINASTMGANAGVLGQWVQRELEVPNGTMLFLNYTLKSSTMPMAKRLYLAFIADDSNPMIELSFPVITDKHSTITELPISGRFRLASYEEVEQAPIMKGQLALMQKSVLDCMQQISPEGMVIHWANLSKASNSEGQPFFAVRGNSEYEEYRITLKFMLPGLKSGETTAKGKTVKTATGRKVLITSRKRKIKLI